MNETWLAHHGILGQKWGIRRFQNKDGTLTEAGKKHAKTNENDEEDLKKKQAKERMNYALVSGGIFAGVSAIKSMVSIAARNKGLKYMSDGQLKLNIGLESAKAAVRAGRAFVLGGAAAYVAEGINQGRSNNLYANPQYRPAGTMMDSPSKPSGTKKSETKSFHEKKKDFMKTYKPAKGSSNSLYDIDDDDLIEMEIDDPDFRKEYGVSDSDYERWKKTVRN